MTDSIVYIFMSPSIYVASEIDPVDAFSKFFATRFFFTTGVPSSYPEKCKERLPYAYIARVITPASYLEMHDLEMEDDFFL